MANINIGGRLHSVATGNVVAGADEILDDNQGTNGKKQSVINAELYQGQENLQEQIDTKQGIIRTVVTPTITEDNGDPAVVASFENSQLTLAFKNLKGDKGDQGEKGDKGDTGEAGESAAVGAGDLALTQILGNSKTKAMSQRGVTDMVMNNFVAEWKQKARDKDTQAIYPKSATTTFTSGSNNNHIHSFAVSKGDIVRVVVSGSNYGTEKGSIGFSDALPVVDATYEELFKPTPVAASEFEAILIAPDNGYIHAYVYSGSSMSCKFYTPVSITEKMASDNATLMQEVQEIEENFDDAVEQLKNISEVTLANLTPPEATNNSATGAADRIGRDSSNTDQYNKWIYASSNSWGYQCDISAYAGKKLKLTVGSKNSAYAFLDGPWTASYRRTTAPFYDVNFCEGETSFHNVSQNTVVEIPESAKYLWVLWKGTVASNEGSFSKIEIVGTLAEKVNEIKVEIKSYHVDEQNGSDDNDGLTAASAFATVTKAAAMSGNDMSIILHGKFNTPINISGKNAVRIQGNDASINSGTRIESAELASGYEGVYVKSGITLPAHDSTYGMWLWQIGVADSSTAISLAERHPAQTTVANRLRATKISKADSIAAVASNTASTYYYDSANHNLYFKPAAEPSASNPILIRAAEEDYGINIQCNELLMTRVIAYGTTVLVNANKAELIECRSLYGCHGFRNNTQYGQAIYLRCEAGGCFAASGNGDGFGGGTSRSTLIDCWAHDCFDDGYSEHNGSRTTIIGGLFEYCGKGGIVPSGSFASIIGTTCRYCGGKPGMSNDNTAGILFTLGAGSFINGDMKNCVSYGNQNNYLVLSSSGSITLENCQSINAGAVGYKKGDGAYMTLRNCTHYGTGSARSPLSSSAVIIQNGTLVS